MLTHVVFSLSPHVHPHAVFARAEEDLSPPLQTPCGSRALLATSPSAWSWFPPCHVWSTFVRRWASLEGLYGNFVLHLTLGLAFRDRSLVCSGSSCYRFGSPGSRSRQSFLECDQHSFLPQLSPQRACGYVPRGQWALLDADMPKLIDRSACLVEPVVVESLCSPCLCCPRTEHVQRLVRSLLAIVPHREALLKVFCSPSCFS